MAEQDSIAILGVGAIGGVLAAALSDAGRSVTLCDRTGFNVLERIFEGETRRYHHPVITSPEELDPVDWLLLCTKAHQVPGAGAWLDRLIGPGTRVGVMQNGIDHAARLEAFVDPDRVVPAIMLLPVNAPIPGKIVQLRVGNIQVPDTPNSRDFVDLFASPATLTFELVADFTSAAWSKLAFNAVGGAIGCLALQPLGALGKGSVRDLAMALFEEVVAVGRAEGAVFPDDFAERTLALFSGPFAEHWESIAVDRREGRNMEWQARNAVVGEKGRIHGIETPLNDAVTALLEVIDTRL